MKILFDCTFLRNRITGVDIGFLGLVEYLLKIDRVNSYIILVDHRFDKSILNNRLNSSTNYKIIAIPCIYPVHILVSAFIIPFYLWIAKIDIYHNPYFFGPLFKLSKTKTVITVHDLYHKTIPEKMNAIHNKLMDLFADPANKRADNVIVISLQTKRDVIKYYKLPEDRMTLIYQALDNSFELNSNEDFSEQIIDKGIKKGEYIFSVCKVLPSKGVDDLIKSYHKLLSIDRNRNIKLVFSGLKETAFFDQMQILITELGLPDNCVVFLGYVTKSDLINLYKNARIYVLPSHFEGFGVTALEAMRFKCPVIVRNASSLPEVVGNAGLLFNTINELTEQMDNLINNDSLRNEINQLSVNQLSKFTNETRAQETLDLYNRLNEA